MFSNKWYIPPWVRSLGISIGEELSEQGHELITTWPLALNKAVRDGLKKVGGKELITFTLSPTGLVSECEFVIAYLSKESYTLSILKEKDVPLFNIAEAKSEVNARDRWLLFKKEMGVMKVGEC